MAAAAAADGDKPSPHLSQPLLPPLPEPYYAYPVSSYPAPPPPPPPPPALLVPVLVHLRRRRRRRPPFLCTSTTLLVLLALLAAVAALILLYPSAPAVRVANLRLDRLRVVPPPIAALDLALALRLGLRNPSFLLPLCYRSVSTAVSYRGRVLGSGAASPPSGELAARATAYADAELWVDAGRILDDALELIGDIAAGSVPLETVTEVVGAIRLFRFNIPVKGLISCSFNVSPDTQRILSQDCY